MEKKFMSKRFLFPAALLILNVTSFASVPSAIWPQKDIKEFQVGKSSSQHKILIVATSSAFKDSVIKDFADSIAKGDSVFVSVVGMKKLLEQKIDNWNAVVIANTCMAWQMDNRVQKFIKKNESYKGFVVLTTSGDPKECGSADKIPKGIDAISSASVEDKRTVVVKELLESVRKKF
jgi:hypothetical protein